ncbi:MAG TPA: ABC transporter substrate-binding protein [Chloroflexota bacterium]|nr:ABC transporter substrate-binding protein [Chloroflexota bacterium]
MRRLAVLLLGVLLAACGGASVAPTSAAPSKPAASAVALERTDVTAAYGTTSGSSAPLWIASEKGFFKKYGLNVNVTYAESNAVTSSLIAGEIQYGIGDGPSALGAMAAGAKLKIFGTLNKNNPYSVVVRPDIKTPADLKGKSIALAKPGDTSDISARIALAPSGLHVGTDVTALSVGNSAPRLAALLSGQVAAALLSEAFVDQAVSQGMHVLVNLEQEHIPYIAAGLEVLDSFGQANPKTTQAYLKGLIEGEKFYADEANKDEVYAILGKYFKTKPDDPTVASNYAFYHQRLAKDPTPEVAGAQTALDALKTIDPPRYANISAEALIDPSYMNAVRDSGFLKAIWGE